MEQHEQQQLNAIKAWLKKNSISIITVIAVGLGGPYGWNTWKNNQLQYKIDASLLYDEIASPSTLDDLPEARLKLTKLEIEYPDTAYPVLGNLIYAKYAYEVKNIVAAVETLEWIINNSEDQIFIGIAGDRLARILIEQNQADKVEKIVINVLGKITNESAIANLNMILGDSHIKLNNIQSAQFSYETAKKNLPARSPLKELIEMKIKDTSSL